MHDEEALIRLSGDIYDAAIEPALWPDAIKGVADFVGAVAGCLITRDCVTGTGGVFYGFGDQPHYRKLYFETYIQHDPVSPALAALPSGEVVSNSGVMPRGEFVKTRFYEEWMEPQGWLDNAFVMLDRSPTKIAAFAISRGREDGWVDDRVYRRMQLIAPHLRRSVLAAEAMRQKSVQAARLAETLDGIDAAVFFADAEGRILHANANGTAMLTDGVLTGAAVAGHEAPHESAGEALLESFVRARREDIAEDCQSVCAPLRSRSGDQYVLHALPLTTGRRRPAAPDHRAVVALFVQKAAIGGSDAAEAIAQHYGLTPMETRVLLTLIDAGGAPETAKVLGIAESTVRTHLRRLFSKTGTGRQLELAKLVAGFSGGLSR